MNQKSSYNEIIFKSLTKHINIAFKWFVNKDFTRIN